MSKLAPGFSLHVSADEDEGGEGEQGDRDVSCQSVILSSSAICPEVEMAPEVAANRGQRMTTLTVPSPGGLFPLQNSQQVASSGSATGETSLPPTLPVTHESFQ